MNSQIQELSPVLIEVKVEIPWERVKQNLDSSFAEVTRSAHVKGFRPGKVPPNIVRQIYGKRVRNEVAAQLIEEGLITAVQKHELAIVAEPQVDAPEMTDGESLKFTARLEVRPKIEKVLAAGIEVPRQVAQVLGLTSRQAGGAQCGCVQHEYR